MTGSIRAYQIADKAACLRIFDSNVPDFFDMSERDLLSDFLDSPIGAYFVVERDGDVIGSGGFRKEDRGQARFTWGMVHRKHHGDGLGQLLAEHRLLAIEKSGEYSEIEIHTTPKVAPFFKKFGFETRKVEPDGFAPGMDQVQMIKNLT
ncbi:MAG: GNAT family N-acetyltransferase [Parasphingorhabdus sp.]